MSEPRDSNDLEFRRALERARQYSATLVGPSLIERLARLPSDARDRILTEFSTLDLARLYTDWTTWARPKQDPDLTAIAHRILFLLAGRGFGKSMSGAQRVRRRVEAGARSIALIGPSLGDVERYMLGGEGGSDGLLSVFPEAQKPKWKAHKRKLYFHTGAIAEINTAEEPEFRGPNLDTVWADEPGKWRYLTTIWSNVELATRLPGRLPLEIIITGTPTPSKMFRDWVADPETVTIIGTQSENAGNLDASYLARMQRKYGGTRLGRQELEGEILTDNPDAIFVASILDATRVESYPKNLRIVIAVDPAIGTLRDNDPTGIVVVGIDDDTGHLYVLADLTARAKPFAWGAAVVKAYDDWRAEAVVVERNRGGDMVADNVRSSMERKRGGVAAQSIKIVEVYATRGKWIRAEPVSTLHERGLIHIVGGMPELEGELCEWNPRMTGLSPNRLDALVWGVYYLAKCGEDERPDYQAGFKGLVDAAEKLRAGKPAVTSTTPTPSSPAALGTPALPWRVPALRGSKL